MVWILAWSILDCTMFYVVSSVRLPVIWKIQDVWSRQISTCHTATFGYQVVSGACANAF
jgi:hypothetical protein